MPCFQTLLTYSDGGIGIMPALRVREECDKLDQVPELLISHQLIWNCTRRIIRETSCLCKIEPQK